MDLNSHFQPENPKPELVIFDLLNKSASKLILETINSRDQLVALESELHKFASKLRHPSINWRTILEGLKTASGNRHFSISTISENLDALTLQLMNNEINNFIQGINFSEIEFESIVRDSIQKQFPTNWYDQEVSFMSARLMAIEEALCLAWVPFGEVLSQIINSSSESERNEILVVNRLKIIEECLNEISKIPETEFKVFVARSLESCKTGHFEASQALAATIIDAFLSNANLNAIKSTDSKYTDWPDVYENSMSSGLSLRAIISITALAKVLDRFNGKDEIPAIFNRHATAHTISEKQYTVSNSIKSNLIITSLLISKHHGDFNL